MSGISLAFDHFVDSSPQAPHRLAGRIKNQAVPPPDFFSGKLGPPVTGMPMTKASDVSPEGARVPC
jgi:hypothetical protein